MIKQSDILTAINRMIGAAFPNYTVYINACPKDFARPSFLLKYIKLSQTDATRFTVEKTVSITITCFVSVDKHDRSDMDELANLQDQVIQLFLPGYIKVGDRALKVLSSTGGIDPDRAYIDLEFNFFDDRTDVEDMNPLIASVSTIIKEG
jgi:hypothetical protein